MVYSTLSFSQENGNSFLKANIKATSVIRCCFTVIIFINYFSFAIFYVSGLDSMD